MQEKPAPPSEIHIFQSTVFQLSALIYSLQHSIFNSTHWVKYSYSPLKYCCVTLHRNIGLQSASMTIEARLGFLYILFRPNPVSTGLLIRLTTREVQCLVQFSYSLLQTRVQVNIINIYCVLQPEDIQNSYFFLHVKHTQAYSGFMKQYFNLISSHTAQGKAWTAHFNTLEATSVEIFTRYLIP